MAKGNITGFFEASAANPELAGKVAALASECGYEFTADELLDVGSVQPLSDGDVENASGGQLRPSEDSSQDLTPLERDWWNKRHRS